MRRCSTFRLATLGTVLGLTACAGAQGLHFAGRYEYRTDPTSRDVLGDKVCFYPDAATAARAPRAAGDGRSVWFCFTDTDAARRRLGLAGMASAAGCGFGGEARVTVARYVVYGGEGDGNDTAELLDAEPGRGAVIACEEEGG